MREVSMEMAIMIVVWVLALPAQQQTEEKMMPEDFGISVKYTGDVGIEKDEDVVFAESFETGGIGDFKSRWDNVSNKDGKVISFSNDVPEVSSGKRSISMTANRNENSGGHLFKVFKPGYDRLYARFYVKFAPDFSEDAFKENEKYAAEHPDFLINTDTASVWFDDIVVARRYVGPIRKE